MEVVIDNSHLKVEGQWKKLWKLKVPNKVRIFLWRVLRGCLPVRARLLAKGVHCDPKCPCCGEYEENEWHCFVGCMAAQEVWKEADCWQATNKYEENEWHCFVGCGDEIRSFGMNLYRQWSKQFVDRVRICMIGGKHGAARQSMHG
jgi:hypothetical protein